MKDIDFWYSIGSTYSYLTIMRLPDYCQKHDLNVNWRPYNVRTVMMEQNNIPFANKPTKSAYMWRDIQRRADLYGLGPKLPAPYPLEHLQLANQVALLGMSEGWGVAFTVESYRRWFEEGAPAGSEPNLSASLQDCGQSPVETITRASGQEAEAALVSETEIAKSIGVFGAPSFVVDQEVFWGDDRLDDAVQWARYGTLRSQV